ncbi:probable ATPase synthesis protein 25, mitochondrial [Fusarium torulosum]|uniref:ATPase synthesis protein 25 n=1 Tax=Fusarium torulosum TaxID=33205 RepID=A0AAE8M4L1_9HYPO|nr:probable ATPase synthesis protein 25, mitochondrial [Fusarium torulosum]
MLRRPVAAALSCRCCQSAIIRAVVSRPATSSFRTLPQTTSKQLPGLATRFFSDARTNDPIIEKDDSVVFSPSDVLDTAAESAEPEDVPWFLEVEPPRHPQNQHAVELPKIPEGAPEVLEPMVKYIFEDMGLDDISLMDMRDLDPPAALGPNLIMLFATARSERHLHISSGRFVRWLKKHHSISARADGLIGPGELRTKLRRLRKKAKLMGTNTAIIPGGDNGISTGWVCVNFSSSGDNIDEAAKIDDSGRFSGFGAPQTGTTVMIQCMTESRRAELDLEGLWQTILKKSIRENKQARGEKIGSPEELEQLLASKVQLPRSESALQWQALQKASKQKRSYTTSAGRLAPDLAQNESIDPFDGLTAEENNTLGETEKSLQLDQVRARFEDIQLVGLPLSQEQLDGFLHDALTAHADEPAAGTRLAFVDQILWTAEERGMEIWTDNMFVALIEAAMLSPSYGQPELERAQKNLETLMLQKDCQLDAEGTFRLMEAYESREDWPRFWDAFRRPPLYKMSRGAKLYTCVYEALRRTNDQTMCIENLRWVYNDMLNEPEPVDLTGRLYRTLKSCITIADPAAPYLADKHTDDFKHLQHYAKRRLTIREYVLMLRDVEARHTQAVEQIARTQLDKGIASMAEHLAVDETETKV